MVNKYYFHKPIFRLSFILILLWCLLVLLTNGISGSIFGTNLIVSCPNNTEQLCENPLYGLCDQIVCKEQYIFPGESFGRKPNFFVEYFSLFLIVTIIISFMLNHFLYNKKFVMDGV